MLRGDLRRLLVLVLGGTSAALPTRTGGKAPSPNLEKKEDTESEEKNEDQIRNTHLMAQVPLNPNSSSWPY